MDAKDTVMTIDNLLTSGVDFNEPLENWLKQALKAQAEISFPLGEEFGRRDEGLLIKSQLRGLIEINDWSEEGLRAFRMGIELKLKEWEE